MSCSFFFQAEDGIRVAQESRGLGDVYKRQPWWQAYNNLVGLAALIFLVFLSAVAYFTASFFKNRRLKKK